MKHLKWAAAALGLAVVPVIAWAGLVHAQQFTNNVDKSRTIDSSLYSAGKTVEINGTINGDVFCAGQTVTIDATVHGDVICAGQDVTVSGKIDGNVRVAGQSVSIDATIARSATVAAMTFSLDAESKIGQDMTANGDTLNIKGAVARDVLANGASVTFNGKVGRNVQTAGNKINLKSDASIAGNFSYTSSEKATIAKDAKVSGKTTYSKPSSQKHNAWDRFSIGFYLFMLFGMAVISLVIAYFFPQFLRKNATRIKDEFTRTLITGLVASFAIPFIALGLIISVVGIPLTIFALIAWLFAVCLSGPIVAYYVGQMVLRKQKNPLLIVLVGSLILVTAYYLPLAGILVLMLAYWLGFGALLIALREHVRPVAAKKTKN